MFKQIRRDLFAATHYERMKPLHRQPRQIQGHAKDLVFRMRATAGMAEVHAQRMLPGHEYERNALRAAARVLTIRAAAIDLSIHPF